MEKVEQTLIFVVPKNEKFELSAWQKEKEMTKDKGYLNPLNFSGESIKHIENEYIKKDFDPIGWLIKSQGYEIDDLYNAEKIEKSKFLSSLNSELTEYEEYLDGHLTFILSYLEKEINEKIVNENNNIKLFPNDNIKIGFMDLEKGKKCGFGIKLEKEVIIPKEFIKTASTEEKNVFLPLKDKMWISDKSSEIEFTTENSMINKKVDIDTLKRKAEIQDEVFSIAKKTSEELNKYFKENGWETEAVALRDSPIELRIIDSSYGDMGSTYEVAKKLYKPLNINSPFKIKYSSGDCIMNYSNIKGKPFYIKFFTPVSAEKIYKLSKNIDTENEKYKISYYQNKELNITITKNEISIVVPENKKEFAKNFVLSLAENYKGLIKINNEKIFENDKFVNKETEKIQKEKNFLDKKRKVGLL
jgi:hypothetical protein